METFTYTFLPFHFSLPSWLSYLTIYSTFSLFFFPFSEERVIFHLMWTTYEREGQGNLACCIPWGHSTEQLNWIEPMKGSSPFQYPPRFLFINSSAHPYTIFCLKWDTWRQQICVINFKLCNHGPALSPQFPHLQNASSNPCLTRVWRRIKWDTSHEALGPMFDTHAHSINIYPFTFFSPYKIESVLRTLLPRLNDNIFSSFPSFQTLNSVPTSSSLFICSSAHCNLASLHHFTETSLTHETKTLKCSEFHRFKYFLKKPRNESWNKRQDECMNR